MDVRLAGDIAEAVEGFDPVERIEGSRRAGVLVICDHASNALPRGYGALGLLAEALERHIAYDIGAAWVTRRLAGLLNAPAVLSTFSRLLIDPNRGPDDPTLVMRYSDGALIPGNARADAAEIERRRRLYWTPYREAVAEEIASMSATGVPPAVLSIHSFTPVWRGTPRPWKIAMLWDADPRLAVPLIEAFRREGDLAAHEVGDNEPYDGALMGDTIHATATRLGLTNALVEIRQDLIARRSQAETWAERLARILPPLIAPIAAREPHDFGTRTASRLTARARPAMAHRPNEIQEKQPT